MSDAGKIQLSSMYGQPPGYALSLPFAFVDASVHEALTGLLKEDLGPHKGKLRRVGITTGSSQYLLEVFDGRTKVRTLSFFLRTVEERVTVILAALDKKPPGFTQDDLSDIIVNLVKMVYANHEDLTNFAQQFPMSTESRMSVEIDDEALASVFQAIQSTTSQPARTDRRRNEDNEWVRQQVQHGRDRGEVFTEYLTRQGVDTADEWAVERARDRFRKALRRKEIL